MHNNSPEQMPVTDRTVDALRQRIDAEFFPGVGHLAIAPERADPVLAVGFDVFGKARIVSEPRVEEVGVRSIRIRLRPETSIQRGIHLLEKRPA